MIILSGAGIVEAGSIDTPSDLDDIWEWWEPEREGLSDNDPISQLTGQVSPGSGHNFTQPTSGERPTFKTGIINGLAVARFDGVDNWLHNVNPSSLTAAHVFIVVKKATDTASGFGLWDLTGNNPAYGFSGGLIREMMFRPGAQPIDMSDPGDLSQWNVYEIVSTSSEYTVRFNGTQIWTEGGSFQTGSNLRIGNNGPFFTDWFNGDVAGFYICSAKLTSARPGMIGYINDRFALTSL